MQCEGLVKQERLFGEFYVVLYIKIDEKMPKMGVSDSFANGVTPALIVCLSG